MKRSKVTEAQIAFAIASVRDRPPCGRDTPANVGLPCNIFQLEEKIRGLDVPELRKLRQLEEENVQLKKLVTDLSLDKQML